MATKNFSVYQKAYLKSIINRNGDGSKRKANWTCCLGCSNKDQANNAPDRKGGKVTGDRALGLLTGSVRIIVEVGIAECPRRVKVLLIRKNQRRQT